jgi:hypothetical protein
MLFKDSPLLQTGDNETEYGCLNFHQNRLLAKGFISRTSEPNSTTSKESFHLVATTTNKYKCLRSEKPISKDINSPKMIIIVKLPRQSDIIEE